MRPPAVALDDFVVAPEAGVAPRAAKPDYDVLLRRLLGAGDALAVVLSLLVTVAVAGDFSSRQMVWGLVAIPLMILLFKLYGLYDRDVKRISHSTVDDLPWLVHAVAVGTLLLWLYSRETRMGRLDFAELTVFAGAAVGFSASIRFCVRQAAVRRFAPERALLVGTGSMARAFVRKLAAHPEYKVEVIGALSDSAFKGADAHGLPLLGSLDELEWLVLNSGVRRVLIVGDTLDQRALEALLLRCRTLALKVSILPRLSDVLGPGLEIDDVEGVAVLGVNPAWLPRSSRAVKRAMDLILAGVLLILCAPFLVAAAIAIRVDSRGPVIFSQERIGRAGRRFRLFKLRTMGVDAETTRSRLVALSSDPNWLKLDRDPRITRVGRCLRRLSLDELPQLWNVVRGEMSMVGPRPLIPDEDVRVEGWARSRLELTPGITGYWQVLGRTRIPFEEMVKLDYLYVTNWSLWEDVRLILRTIPAVFGGKGAN
jgi:exopolysaccharide biosynthesis polyprenyl glycosylphosphotransferase